MVYAADLYNNTSVRALSSDSLVLILRRAFGMFRGRQHERLLDGRTSVPPSKDALPK